MQISWWTLALQVVNFLVLVWLLQRFLYKPVLDVIERRKQLSLDAAAKAERLRTEANALKQRYETALAGIESERRASVEQAHAAVEAELAKALQEARKKADSLVENARADVGKERTAALADLQQEISDLAVQLAQRLLADLAPSIPSEVMLARLEQQLGQLSEADRRRLLQEISSNGASVAVTTSKGLTPDEQARWKARLETTLGQPLQPTFEEDRALLTGAELRLPHMTVHASWADLLRHARTALMGGAGDEPRR